MSTSDEYSLATSVHLAILYFLLQRPYFFTSPVALGAKYVDHIGTHLLSNHFVAAVQICTSEWSFIKKETPEQVFPCEFCKIFKGTFLTEHLQETAYVGEKYYAVIFIATRKDKYQKIYFTTDNYYLPLWLTLSIFRVA